MLTMIETVAAGLSPLGININSIAFGLTLSAVCMECDYPQAMIDLVAGIALLRRLCKPEEYLFSCTPCTLRFFFYYWADHFSRWRLGDIIKVSALIIIGHLFSAIIGGEI